MSTLQETSPESIIADLKLLGQGYDPNGQLLTDPELVAQNIMELFSLTRNNGAGLLRFGLVSLGYDGSPVNFQSFYNDLDVSATFHQGSVRFDSGDFISNLNHFALNLGEEGELKFIKNKSGSESNILLFAVYQMSKNLLPKIRAGQVSTVASAMRTTVEDVLNEIQNNPVLIPSGQLIIEYFVSNDKSQLVNTDGSDPRAVVYHPALANDQESRRIWEAVSRYTGLSLSEAPLEGLEKTFGTEVKYFAEHEATGTNFAFSTQYYRDTVAMEGQTYNTRRGKHIVQASLMNPDDAEALRRTFHEFDVQQFNMLSYNHPTVRLHTPEEGQQISNEIRLHVSLEYAHLIPGLIGKIVDQASGK